MRFHHQYSMLISGALCLITTLFSCAAFGATWDDTFDPQRLATYLSQQSARIMVARGGAVSPDTDRCAVALQTALRRCSGVKLVMDDQAIGRSNTMEDQAIVKKANTLPLDLVAVIRVFPGADGDAPSAVVTFYDKTGKAVNALTATKGEQISAYQQSTAVSPGQGVDSAAIDSVSSVVKTNRKRQKGAIKEYKRRRIYFNTATAINIQTGQVVAQWAVPLVGEPGRPLEGSNFYNYVGRADLASSYRRNMAIKWTLVPTGYLLMLAGTTAGLLYLLKDRTDLDVSEDEKESNKKLGLGLLIGMGGGGLIMGMVGSFWKTHPVSAEEAIHLAESYNEGLKKELGLQEDDEEDDRDSEQKTAARRQTEQERLSLRIAPVVSPNTYGITLGFTF